MLEAFALARERDLAPKLVPCLECAEGAKRLLLLQIGEHQRGCALSRSVLNDAPGTYLDIADEHPVSALALPLGCIAELVAVV